jgi:hypothetical protein
MEGAASLLPEEGAGLETAGDLEGTDFLDAFFVWAPAREMVKTEMRRRVKKFFILV